MTATLSVTSSLTERCCATSSRPDRTRGCWKRREQIWRWKRQPNTPSSTQRTNRRFTIRIPSVLGALYAKASAWHMIKNARDPNKHLQDAAALLTIARLPELHSGSNAVRRRLVWLHGELTDPNSIGWQYVTAQPRTDAIVRLSTALEIG